MKIFKIIIPLPDNLPPDIFYIDDCQTEEEAERKGTKLYNAKRGTHLHYSISLPSNKTIIDITNWSNEKKKHIDIFYVKKWNKEVTDQMKKDIENNDISPSQFRIQHITPYI